MLQFIFSKLFIRHMALAVLFGIGVLVGLHFWMASATEHDIIIDVPSYLGIPKGKLEQFSDTIPLEYVIIDSIYSDEFPKGTVADQDPAPGTGAKRGRKVYLTMNASLPQQIKMPDLHNLSFRQARAILETVGLRLGEISYQPDIAKNAVLEQEVKGRTVHPGQLLFKGSKVDLVLGDGLSDLEMPIPYLLYHKLDSARELLRSLSLNLGALVVDTPVTDTALLRVYKQIPTFDADRVIRGGSSVDLFLTQDTSAIIFDRLRFRQFWERDTLVETSTDIEVDEE